MAEKNLQISLLLDFYGQLLTEKQREVVESYYNEDLSLAEIAQHSGITRQGVRDCIKRAELQLLECEEKLGLMRRFHLIQQHLGEIVRCAQEIEQQSTAGTDPASLRSKTRHIIAIAESLNA